MWIDICASSDGKNVLQGWVVMGWISVEADGDWEKLCPCAALWITLHYNSVTFCVIAKTSSVLSHKVQVLLMDAIDCYFPCLFILRCKATLCILWAVLHRFEKTVLIVACFCWWPYLILPYREVFSLPSAEASSEPNMHPRINHKVTKSPSVVLTWVHTSNGTIPVSYPLGLTHYHTLLISLRERQFQVHINPVHNGLANPKLGKSRRPILGIKHKVIKSPIPMRYPPGSSP